MQDLSTLTQALKDATLEEIVQQVLGQVKSHPQDLKAREVLIKLYCVDGRWDNALQQVQTLSLIDEGARRRTELYKNLIFSEMQRQQVLNGERQAATLQGNIPPWMALLHQANAAFGGGEKALATALRDSAFSQAPESGGSSDTLGSFAWIADSDGRLGPVCEFICAGGYRWLPYADIGEMTVSSPADLLDLLWLPTTIKAQGETWYGYIPARYPLTETCTQAIKLGSKTEWRTESENLSTGRGRKVLITDLSEQAIMEVGHLVFA